MNPTDARAFRRAAIVLLALSSVRWGWQSSQDRAVRLEGVAADTVGALLAESQDLTEAAARRSEPLSPGERVDLNTAGAELLDRLPGIGPSTASAIITSRERDGPFQRVDDLTRVAGIGDATLRKIRPHLEAIAPAARPSRAVERRPSVGSRPSAAERSDRSRRPRQTDAAALDLNRATVEELQRLPGIGPALAERIAAHRLRSPFQRVDDLLAVSGIGPATLGRIRASVVVR